LGVERTDAHEVASLNRPEILQASTLLRKTTSGR
jgi:hypothetical protein